MAQLRAEKYVSNLPGVLEANTIYFVRTGAGFDIYVTNDTGTIVAYPLNASTSSTNITTNRQPANYTLVLTDKDKLVEMDVATANTLTVPLNSTVAFPTGSQILVSQYGAGLTSIVPAGGVTIRSANGSLDLGVQYIAATLIKIATDEWYLFGGLEGITITSGTAAPSGGNDGDIYLQYT